jgi:hypothetical protein
LWSTGDHHFEVEITVTDNINTSDDNKADQPLTVDEAEQLAEIAEQAMEEAKAAETPAGTAPDGLGNPEQSEEAAETPKPKRARKPRVVKAQAEAPKEDAPKRKPGRPRKPEIVPTDIIRTAAMPEEVLDRAPFPVYKSITDRVRKQVEDLRDRPVQIGSVITLGLLFTGDELATVQGEFDRAVDAVSDQQPIGGLFLKERPVVFLGGDASGNLNYMIGTKGQRVVRMRQNKDGKRTYQAIGLDMLTKQHNVSVRFNNINFDYWLTDLTREQHNFPPKPKAVKPETTKETAEPVKAKRTVRVTARKTNTKKTVNA